MYIYIYIYNYIYIYIHNLYSIIYNVCRTGVNMLNKAHVYFFGPLIGTSGGMFLQESFTFMWEKTMVWVSINQHSLLLTQYRWVKATISSHSG